MRARTLVAAAGLAVVTGCLSLPSTEEYASATRMAPPVEAGVRDGGAAAANDALAAPIFSCPSAAIGIPCVQTSGGCFDGASQQATYDLFIDDVLLIAR